MRLNSDSIQNGKPIPANFAFMEVGDPIKPAGNVTPHLAWTEVPASARSFAIAVIDTDVPSKPDDVNVEGREVRRDLPPRGIRALADGQHSPGMPRAGRRCLRRRHRAPWKRKIRWARPARCRASTTTRAWFKGDRDMGGPLPWLRWPVPAVERHHPPPLPLPHLCSGRRERTAGNRLFTGRVSRRDQRPRGGPGDRSPVPIR